MNQLTGEHSLLAAMSFSTFAAANKFARGHFCPLCKGSLMPIAAGCEYEVHCRMCTLSIIDGSCISKYALRQIESNDLETQMVTRQRGTKTETQLLKELGYE